jgi:hypothetical protein
MRTLAFTVTKICDLIFISILFFFSALLISLALNRLCIIFFPQVYGTKKITIAFISEIVFRITFIIVMCYIFRNLVQQVPSPFDGIYGFRHSRVKEISSGTLLTTLSFFFQTNLRNDATLLGNQFFNIQGNTSF